MTKLEQIDLRKARWMAVLACVGLVSPVALEAASITEPATVFYGKITGTAGDRPFLLTEGELQWTILRPDGTTLPLRTEIWPLHDGEYSYRLDVPHAALALGLDSAQAMLPLAAAPETSSHFRIKVDGAIAQLVGPADLTFDADQVRRASTYRADLEVPLAPVDTDGDGMPDWWEDTYGLDKQEGADASGDLDGDGILNLHEYRNGSDAPRDDRQPTLAAGVLPAYAEGATAVMLRSIDADSAATDLTYTLVTLPASGTLYLRRASADPAAPDLALATGAEFTQQDVLNGRLIYAGPDPAAGFASFELSVRDQDPAHASATGSVVLSVYAPADPLENLTTAEMVAMAESPVPFAGMAVAEERKFRNYLLSRAEGYVIWDGSGFAEDQELIAETAGSADSGTVSRFGPDRPQVLIGGRGNDRLVGGWVGDHLIGGAGNDLLQGNAGADRYVFEAGSSGDDTIVDFNPAEGDVLDFSRWFEGAAAELRSYVQVEAAPTGTLLRLDRDGAGGYSDGSVLLTGISPAEADLYRLVGEGHLAVGNLRLTPRISIAAGSTAAGENGPLPGEFWLSREGDLSTALTVKISVGGSATNGSDYSAIFNEVDFPAGAQQVRIPVLPYADSQIEPSETVEMLLLAGTGYETATNRRAELQIRDLRAVVSIELLNPIALRGEGRAAQVRISRNVILDRDLFLALDFSGSAVNGVDFAALPGNLTFAPGQSSYLLNVEPLPGGSAGMQDLRIAIAENDDFQFEGAASAHLVIVDEPLSLASWKTLHHPDTEESLAAFARSYSPGSRISHLVKYAFGLELNRKDIELKQALPQYKVEDGHGVITFRRPAAIDDVVYVVEASTDLKSWRSDASLVENLGRGAIEGEWRTEAFRMVPAVSENEMQYFRVQLIYQP